MSLRGRRRCEARFNSYFARALRIPNRGNKTRREGSPDPDRNQGSDQVGERDVSQGRQMTHFFGDDCKPPHSMAESAGIDTTVCELCEEPLDDKWPWKRGLDGCGAHLDCLEVFDA